MVDKTYNPNQNNRRSEFFIWMLTLLLMALSGYLINNGLENLIINIGVIGMVITALFLSFGNWIDRNSSLTLSKSNLTYSSGFRNISLGWDEIHELYVYPGKYADRIFVMGQNRRITFSLQKDLKNNATAKLGFPKGNEIMNKIHAETKITKSSKKSKKNYYYYSKA